MTNPYRGEVELSLNGVAQKMRLSLGALAELESKCGSILELVKRFEGGAARAEDVLNVLEAGLRGADWQGSETELKEGMIEGGYVAAVQTASRLLAVSFGVLDD